MRQVKALAVILLLGFALTGVGTVTVQAASASQASEVCPAGFTLVEPAMGGAEGAAAATEAAATEAAATEEAYPAETAQPTVAAPGAEATMAATEGAMGMGNLCTLMAVLSGPDELHDADGTGTAYFTFNLDTNEVCYKIEVANITLPATQAHIHTGGLGVDGPPVIPLNSPDASGYVEGCASEATPDTIAGILGDPAGYYVNVHTEDFPDGAVRGQLTGTFPLSGTGIDLPAEADVNAHGAAFATLNRERSELCYGFWAEGLSAPATGAGLYAGASGQEGQSALNLALPGPHGLASACTPLDPALFDQIAQNPQGYYFALTSDQFPSGALRGQWPSAEGMGAPSQ